MSLNLESTISVSDDVICVDVGQGDTMLLDSRHGIYYSLSSVAAFLWRRWQEDGRIDSSIHRLVADYQVDAPTATADVADLINTLVERELITVHN